jgi:hypothetical protein
LPAGWVLSEGWPKDGAARLLVESSIKLKLAYQASSANGLDNSIVLLPDLAHSSNYPRSTMALVGKDELL